MTQTEKLFTSSGFRHHIVVAAQSRTKESRDVPQLSVELFEAVLLKAAAQFSDNE